MRGRSDDDDGGGGPLITLHATLVETIPLEISYQQLHAAKHGAGRTLSIQVDEPPIYHLSGVMQDEQEMMTKKQQQEEEEKKKTESPALLKRRGREVSV